MRPITSPVVPDRPLELRPLEEADVAAWFEYVSDPEAMRHTSSDIHAPEELLSMVRRANSNEPGTPVYFAVCLEPEGRFIGCVGFHSISIANRTAEVTYDIHPQYQGRGFATATCAAALSWGFTDQGLVRIQATVLESNAASIKVLEHTGFEFEGKLRNFRVVRGRPRNFLMYSRIPTDSPT